MNVSIKTYPLLWICFSPNRSLRIKFSLFWSIFFLNNERNCCSSTHFFNLKIVQYLKEFKQFYYNK